MALKGRRSTSEERLRAVQLLKEGNEAVSVARMFNVSRAMLFRWQQKYDQGGPVALETKKTPGPASRLSPTQLSKLFAIITGSDPRQLEFDFGLWTRKIIRELIRREFGVKFSEVQVGRLLKKMGLSPQRPLYRAYQQDPERVEEWKKYAYPKIRKLAAEEGASIFFADEASIRTDHHAGTTWAPVGQTPVVITTGERRSVNMISAISTRGELRFRVQEGKMNAGKFIDFLKALLDSVPGKVFLIVDGHPVHKAKKVSEFVREKAGGRLSIFFLPPYSPDLNPDEWVWNNVKNDRIGRSVIMSADDLKAKAIGALRRLQKLPDIVRGFLRDPKLAYILELHKRTTCEVYKLIFSLVTAILAERPEGRYAQQDPSDRVAWLAPGHHQTHDREDSREPHRHGAAACVQALVRKRGEGHVGNGQGQRDTADDQRGHRRYRREAAAGDVRRHRLPPADRLHLAHGTQRYAPTIPETLRLSVEPPSAKRPLARDDAVPPELYQYRGRALRVCRERK